jgi:hypothetical protein
MRVPNAIDKVCNFMQLQGTRRRSTGSYRAVK